MPGEKNPLGKAGVVSRHKTFFLGLLAGALVGAAFAAGYGWRHSSLPTLIFTAIVPLAAVTFAIGVAATGSWARLPGIRYRVKERSGNPPPNPAAHPTPDSVRCLLDSAFDGMVIVQAGVCRESNRILESMLGFSREELRGKPLADLFTAREAGIVETIAETRGVEEKTALTSNGREITVEVQKRDYPEAGPGARVVSVRDISARRQSEAALHKSEEHLRTVIAYSPLVLFAFDSEGIFTLAEGRGLELLGLESDKVVGRSVRDKLGHLPEVRDAVERALRGETVTLTLPISGLVFETHCRPICGADGQVVEVIGTAMDVTKRERAEEELRTSRENLATVISNAPIVLFALNRKGVFTLCEGKGLESIGLKPGETMGVAAADLFVDSPAILDNIARALAGEAFTATVEYHERVFETHYRPVIKGFGEITGVIGVAMDITGRRQAENALKRSEDHLQQIQKMEAIGRVAAGVAHDFNNLLTTITGYCDMLSSGLEPEDVRVKHVENILGAAERATTVTRQLLAFSRNQILNPKEMNLNAVVKSLDKILRRLLREDVEMVTLLDPNLKPVKADPGQIEQVLLNLAMNARDAMPNGGQMSVETANVWMDGVFTRSQLNLPPGPYSMLRVSDTGVGMDAEMIKHVFEPFYTTKMEDVGSGLGLATVYGIVKQSGGNIWVDSTLGQGTSFRVYLPQIPVANAATVPAPARPQVKGAETVLLVEDEEAVRTLIKEILGMHGFSVLEARDGGEAVLISERYEGFIDLLLTDMVMDNMSGRQLAERLHPMRPEMRLLYISGYANEGMLTGREGEMSGAFLAKPFTPKTLVMKVREILKTPLGDDAPVFGRMPAILPDKRILKG